MKNFLFAVVSLFSLASIAGGVPGNATGQVMSAEPANVISPVTTISGQCATPATGCAAGQFASIKLGGRSSVTVQLITANFTGTFSPYFSVDNGANWYQGFLNSSSTPFNGLSAPVVSKAFAASTVTQALVIVVPTAATDVMIASTAAVTNTATVQLTASFSVPNFMQMVSASKGVQSSGYVGVQEPKDAGRAFVVLSADGVTPAIADTLITFSKSVAGTVTGAQTTYAITNGKTLRVQSLCASFTAGAAANIARVRLRLNTGGACLVGSGLLLSALELAPQYGTATASEGWAAACVPIPDGLELSGASWNVCISESAVAASGTLTVALVGFEY